MPTAMAKLQHLADLGESPSAAPKRAADGDSGDAVSLKDRTAETAMRALEPTDRVGDSEETPAELIESMYRVALEFMGEVIGKTDGSLALPTNCPDVSAAARLTDRCVVARVGAAVGDVTSGREVPPEQDISDLFAELMPGGPDFDALEGELMSIFAVFADFETATPEFGPGEPAAVAP